MNRIRLIIRNAPLIVLGTLAPFIGLALFGLLGLIIFNPFHLHF